MANEALRLAVKDITWFYSSDGHLLNATVTNGGRSEGLEIFDWYWFKTLFDWGIWKTIGEVSDAGDDCKFEFFII